MQNRQNMLKMYYITCFFFHSIPVRSCIYAPVALSLHSTSFSAFTFAFVYTGVELHARRIFALHLPFLVFVVSRSCEKITVCVVLLNWSSFFSSLVLNWCGFFFSLVLNWCVFFFVEFLWISLSWHHNIRCFDVCLLILFLQTASMPFICAVNSFQNFRET